MGLFSARYTRPGPGIPKNAPQKKGVALFFEILSREFIELVKLNLVFCLFCLPVVTIPAACTAMSRLTLTMVRDKNHFLWADFVKAFKADFVKSTVGGVLVFGGVLLSLYGLNFYSSAVHGNSFFYLPMCISGMLLLALSLTGFSLFPMIALVDLPLPQLLKNAFFLSFIGFPHNLAALAVVCVLLALVIALLPFTLLLLPVFFFAPCNLITTFAVYPGIRKYVIAPDAPPDA